MFQLSQLIGGELAGTFKCKDMIGGNTALLGVVLTHPNAGALALRTILGHHRIVHKNEDAGGIPLGGNDRNKGKSKEQAHERRSSHR